jgi:hypothetical protein
VWEAVVVALAVLAALVLIARPANEGSMPVEDADLLPRAVTDTRTPDPATPPPARARRPPATPAATTPLVRASAVDRLQSP